MAINRKTSPTGVDKPVDTLQVAIYNGLVDTRGWLDYESYHRAYKNDKHGLLLPEVFEKNNDYQLVVMNDNFNVTSFFLVDDVRTINDGGLTEVTISIIFQANLKKLFPAAPDTQRFDEELINDVSSVLDRLGGQFTVTEIATTIDDVYAGFDTDKLKERGDDMEKFNVVRFNIATNYSANCSDEYATSGAACAILATVSTTPPMVLGGDDGTATANVTGTVNGTLSYLWTTSDGSIPSGEEIKPTASGLIAGTYSVVVTDSIPDSCTASNSGIVPEGEFEPDSLAGLELWLDASDAATVINPAATPPSFNDNVEEWLDKSVNNVDAIQLTPSAQFLWKIDYMQLDGNDWMTLGMAISKLPIRSFYCVFKLDSLSDQFIYGDINSGGSNVTTSLRLRASAATSKYESSIGDGVDSSIIDGSSSVTTNITLFSERFTSGVGGGLTKMKINGIDETETDGGGTGATTIAGAKQNFSIGRIGDFTSLNMTGRLYGFVLYDTELSDANDTMVNDYMIAQHGV